jgi:hypothetical protein
MSFKVIDGGGPGKEEREQEQKRLDEERRREWSRAEFSWAIRDCAANMLRIVGGAGKPYELLKQMQEAIRAAVNFQETHGYWPQEVITDDLQIEDVLEKSRKRLAEGTLDQAYYDRWWQDGTFDRGLAERRMYRGSLRAIASELVRQNTQKIAGQREFHEGLSHYEQAREKRARWHREEARAAKSPASKAAVSVPRKPIDLGPGPADEDKGDDIATKVPSAAVSGRNRRHRGFDQHDLKELRKAIKAKDSKKIAELTTKIGQREP